MRNYPGMTCAFDRLRAGICRVLFRSCGSYDFTASHDIYRLSIGQTAQCILAQSLRLLFAFLIFISPGFAEDHFTPHSSDAMFIYTDALNENSVELQSKKYNEALSLYLSQKPSSPSAIWHYNVGACLLALHEPGMAVYHFLEAIRLDPSLELAKYGFMRAREACTLNPNMHEFRPFWVLPSISFTILESAFLALVLTAFVIGSLGLMIRYWILVKVSTGIGVFACLFGLILLFRFLDRLMGLLCIQLNYRVIFLAVFYQGQCFRENRFVCSIFERR